jgi:hypothetical protein
VVQQLQSCLALLVLAGAGRSLGATSSGDTLEPPSFLRDR